MLKVNIIAETENDVFNPMTIANALVEDPDLNIGDLEEIAEHLLIYVTRCRLRQEEVSRNIDIYRKEHGLD